MVNDEEIPTEAIAISVITGFLGSGKTTLLNYLLQHPEIDETAVLVNEFGEVGLDHLLVAELEDEVLLLSSGCICCTVQGELVDSLKGLYMKRLAGTLPPFKRVIIETTGLADPVPIITCLMKDPLFKHAYRLESLVTTVDGVYGEGQLDTHPEAVRQAAVADRIIITKTDLAEAPILDSLKSRLADLNPGARVIPAEKGQVSPNELFDVTLYDPKTKTIDVQRWLNEEAYVSPGGDDHHEDGDHDHHHGHDHGHGHDDGHGHGHDHSQPVNVNRHDDHITSYCLYIDRPLPWHPFLNWFEDLANELGDHLLRVKGLVNIAGEDVPYTLHCVQATRYTPEKLSAWPDDDRRSRIVFITHDLDEATVQANLDAWLDSLPTETGTAPTSAGASEAAERWLNEGEITRLFGVLVGHGNQPAADALRLMLLTGTRWFDARDARWEHMNLSRKVWLKPTPETRHKQPRRIRLSAPALVLLSRLEAEKKSEWLFPGDTNDAPANDIETLWAEVTQAASIENANLERLRPSLASHLFADQDAEVLGPLLGAPVEGISI